MRSKIGIEARMYCVGIVWTIHDSLPVVTVNSLELVPLIVPLPIIYRSCVVAMFSGRRSVCIVYRYLRCRYHAKTRSCTMRYLSRIRPKPQYLSMRVHAANDGA